MIRLTWLQFRTQAVTAAAALAAFAVLLAATGPHLASMSAADGLGRPGRTASWFSDRRARRRPGRRAAGPRRPAPR
jgi:hypothetical protein